MLASTCSTSFSVLPSSAPSIPSRHRHNATFCCFSPPARPAWLRSLLLGAFPLATLPRASLSASIAPAKDYEFTDGNGEMELRLDIGKLGIENSRDVFVDVNDTSLLVRAKSDGTPRTLINVKQLFDRIKSSETIWFLIIGSKSKES